MTYNVIKLKHTILDFTPKKILNLNYCYNFSLFIQVFIYELVAQSQIIKLLYWQLDKFGKPFFECLRLGH